MDTRNKIFVYYDRDSKSDVKEHFRNLTSDYAQYIFEIDNFHYSDKFDRIYVVTSDEKKIYGIERKYEKYSKKVSVIYMTDKRMDLKKISWATEYTVFIDWIEASREINYHFNQMKKILTGTVGNAKMTTVEDRTISELFRFGGMEILDMLNKFKSVSSM